MDVITQSQRQLLHTSMEARVKLFNMDAPLRAIADSLGEIKRRLDAMQSQIDRQPGAPSVVTHAKTCECKVCAIARMLELDRLENP